MDLTASSPPPGKGGRPKGPTSTRRINPAREAASTCAEPVQHPTAQDETVADQHRPQDQAAPPSGSVPAAKRRPPLPPTKAGIDARALAAARLFRLAGSVFRD